jgi:hypothetical protein
MRRVLVLLLLLATACGTGAAKPATYRVVATPLATGHSSVEVDTPKPTSRTKTAAPKVAAEAVAAPRSKALPVPVPKVAAVGISSFRSLGSWLDVFDYNDDPASVVPLVKGIAAKGNKTLYLETARFQSSTDIQYPKALGAALDEAKARGLKVVAWYPPTFDDMARDLRRSIKAVEFRSPKGNRFDAFGSDIEYTQGVPDHAERSRRAVEYSKKLRAHVGVAYPMSAIVIPPTSLEVNKTRWPEFPWQALSAYYDVFQPMNYWTAHGKDTATATDLTKRNVTETRRLTGKPVHIIGGLGADSDEQQVAAYVKAAKDAGSIGGGLYDYTTTRNEVWDELRKLL